MNELRRILYAWLVAVGCAVPLHAANEIQYEDPALTGQTLYYVLTVAGGDSESGESWDGDSWETYTATRADWDLAMTEVGVTGRFRGSLPSAVASYNKPIWWNIYRDANDDSSPDHEDDELIATGYGWWNGTHLGVNPVSIYNGGHFAPTVLRTTVSSVTSQTDLVPVAASAENNSYVGCTIFVRDNIAPNNCIQGVITSSTDVSLAFNPLGSPAFVIAAGDFIEVHPPGFFDDDRTTLSSVSGGTVSAFNVDVDHTWKFDNRQQVTSPNDINENIGFNGLCSMDFTQPMPALSAISAVNSVSIADEAGETEPTISSSAKSADQKKVNIVINATSATEATYTVTVKITTTDSQVFVRKGRLVIR